MQLDGLVSLYLNGFNVGKTKVNWNLSYNSNFTNKYIYRNINELNAMLGCLGEMVTRATGKMVMRKG